MLLDITIAIAAIAVHVANCHWFYQRGKQVAADVELDAARYRWLRDDAGDEWTVCQEIGQDLTAVYLGGDELDAAIDAAKEPGQ